MWFITDVNLEVISDKYMPSRMKIVIKSSLDFYLKQQYELVENIAFDYILVTFLNTDKSLSNLQDNILKSLFWVWL